MNTSRRQEEGRCPVTSDGDGDGGKKERKTKGREGERMNDSAQQKLVWKRASGWRSPGLERQGRSRCPQLPGWAERKKGGQRRDMEREPRETKEKGRLRDSATPDEGVDRYSKSNATGCLPMAGRYRRYLATSSMTERLEIKPPPRPLPRAPGFRAPGASSPEL